MVRTAAAQKEAVVEEGRKASWRREPLRRGAERSEEGITRREEEPPKQRPLGMQGCPEGSEEEGADWGDPGSRPSGAVPAPAAGWPRGLAASCRL